MFTILKLKHSMKLNVPLMYYYVQLSSKLKSTYHVDNIKTFNEIKRTINVVHPNKD